MTSDLHRCPHCGQGIPREALGGLCPHCVVRFSFGIASADPASPEGAVEPGSLSGAGVANTDAASPDAVWAESLFGPADGGTEDRSGDLRRFGNYELIEELGRGGMGLVYRARQLALNRIVAVKLIPFGPLATAESIRRFRAEAEAAAQLRHPHIVAIHEIGEHAGQHFFSMDCIEGGTLADQLVNGPWPARRAATCLRTVADAVQHAHDAGLLHRDLKPSNILLDSQGAPHVADFGLARKLGADATLTQPGQVVGSPSYLPPEHAGTNDQMRPAATSDVYSLGAVLYHAITGRPPFQAESVEAVLVRVTRDDPISPRLLNPSVPRDLETICLKCLEKVPTRRYATARDLGEELDRFLDDEPIRARPATAAYKVWRWCRRRPALAAALALLMLVGLLGTTGIAWQWRRAESAAANTRLNLYAADMALAYRALAAGDRGRARQLLDAYHTLPGEELRGWEWRYLWQQCRGDERLTLGHHRGAVVTMDYSPDGRHLASADVRGTLTVWNVASQRIAWTTNLSEGRVNAIAFSPDGRWLAQATARRKIWLWNARTWQTSGSLVEPDVSDLAFSPDSETLVAANGMEVAAWNVETRARQKEIPPSRGRPHPRQIAFAPDGRTLAVGDENGVLVLWDWSTGTEQPGWRAHRPPVDASAALEDIIYAPVGRLFATAGDDRTVKIWTAPQRYRPLTNHTDIVRSVAFSPDGRKLVSGAMDQTVRLWDVATQKELGSWHAHAGGCLQVRFAPDGQSFASAGIDGLIKIWNVEPHHDRSTSTALPALVRDAIIVGPPARLAFSLRDDSWRVWTLPSCEEVFRGTQAMNMAVSLKDLNGHRLAEYGGRSVRVRRLDNGAEEMSMSLDLGEVLGVDLAPDQRSLAVSGVNGLVVLEVPSGQVRRRWLTPAEGWGRHVRLAPDGATLVTIHERDGTVGFYNIATGNTRLLPGHLIGSAVSAFSMDGRWLATAGVGSAIRIYDVVHEAEINALETDAVQVTALAFAPDATRLGCGLSRGFISVWHLPTGREVAVFPGHTGLVYSVAFVDGDTLASASRDEIRFWHAPDWKTIEQATATRRE